MVKSAKIKTKMIFVRREQIKNIADRIDMKRRKNPELVRAVSHKLY